MSRFRENYERKLKAAKAEEARKAKTAQQTKPDATAQPVAEAEKPSVQSQAKPEVKSQPEKTPAPVQSQSRAKAKGSSVQTQESKMREANDDSKRGLSSAEYLGLKGEIQGLQKEIQEFRKEIRGEVSGLKKATERLHGQTFELLEELRAVVADCDYDDALAEEYAEPEPELKPELEPEELPRPMWIFRYPTKDGTIKKTLFYDQALEEALDTDMICRYVGWDIPGFPKLTDGELQEQGISL